MLGGGILELMNQISDLQISGKRVLVRGDLDVPIKTTNDKRLTTNADSETATRLTNLKPSIDYLFNENAKIIIIGHIDRPSPRLRNGRPVIDTALSTKQLLDPFQKIFKRTVVFKKDFQDDSTDIPELGSQITLFENLRFWPGETASDMDFAQKLAQLADFYVNDAFGNCHREHASMVLLPKLLPSAVGISLENEIDELSKVLNNPDHPFVVIVGGAKIETKLPVIENLAKIADFVLVGGELPIEIRKKQIKFTDNVIIANLIRDDMDIDNESIRKFCEQIAKARLVVWNGPLGLFEEGHINGTIEIAKAIIASPAYEVVGGGETTQFLEANQMLSKFSFVSAGGGAMLEFLAGRKLPAIEALGGTEARN